MRKFNMSYVRRVGALEDSFLGSGLPYGTARILYEIGLAASDSASATTVQDLRTRLGGLDSGYVSRMLRTLESKGYVAMDRDPSDGRRRLVALTEDGLKQWDDLERRSEERAHLLLDPLTQRQRDRLNEALATADLLVRAAAITIEQVDPRDPMRRRRWAPLRRDRRPFRVHRRRRGLRRRPLPSRAPRRLLRGRQRRRPGRLRCGPRVRGHRRDQADVGRSRLARRGPRLTPAAPPGGRGAAAGPRVVRLDTRDVLSEAIGMYERAGYERIDRYNDNPHATHFFRKQLG